MRLAALILFSLALLIKLVSRLVLTGSELNIFRIYQLFRSTNCSQDLILNEQQFDFYTKILFRLDTSSTVYYNV